ncbi:MAG TPA: hypothetical protein ENI45_04050, partial [Thermoplasmatales archaeon]|nr:hypothetical protein [Thermoplasmatales archaeon]
MRARKEKIEIIHEAIDTLFQEKGLVETIPSVAFNDDVTLDENIVEKVKKIIPESEREEAFADTVTTKPTAVFPPLKKRLMSPPVPSHVESAYNISTSSSQNEIPFLIFETPEHVEELLLNPTLSQRAAERIEEFNVGYPVEDTLLYETKMFGVSDASKKIFTSNTSKLSLSLLRQEHKGPALETLQPAPLLPPRSTKETKTVLEKTKYFGYKKLGSRTVVFDKNTKEYKYVVKEPILTEEEEAVKEELIKLFKLLADIPVFETEEQEKQRLLEEALDQIIKDNGIKIPTSSQDVVFYPPVKGFVSHDKIDAPMREVNAVDVYCDKPFEEMLRQTLTKNGIMV